MSTVHTIPVNRTVYHEVKIHIIECASCQIDFGIGADFMRRRREDHQNFFCPNGHLNVYTGPTEDEKKIKRLERELGWETDARQRAQRNAEHQRRSASAYKGQLTKLRRRIANGVCPVAGCKRSFDRDPDRRSPTIRHLFDQHEQWVADHAKIVHDAGLDA